MSNRPSISAAGARQRQVVRATLPCPFCSAEAGQKCIGVTGRPRSSLHQERWQLYRERRDATLQ